MIDLNFEEMQELVTEHPAAERTSFHRTPKPHQLRKCYTCDREEHWRRMISLPNLNSTCDADRFLHRCVACESARTGETSEGVSRALMFHRRDNDLQRAQEFSVARNKVEQWLAFVTTVDETQDEAVAAPPVALEGSPSHRSVAGAPSEGQGGPAAGSAALPVVPSSKKRSRKLARACLADVRYLFRDMVDLLKLKFYDMEEARGRSQVPGTNGEPRPGGWRRSSTRTRRWTTLPMSGGASRPTPSRSRCRRRPITVTLGCRASMCITFVQGMAATL